MTLFEPSTPQFFQLSWPIMPLTMFEGGINYVKHDILLEYFEL